MNFISDLSENISKILPDFQDLPQPTQKIDFQDLARLRARERLKNSDFNFYFQLLIFNF